MVDILDNLQNVDSFVRLTLKSGEIIFGHPDCIVWDEDKDGWETIKTIRFEPYYSKQTLYFTEDEIDGFEEFDESEIPPME